MPGTRRGSRPAARWLLGVGLAVAALAGCSTTASSSTASTPPPSSTPASPGASTSAPTPPASPSASPSTSAPAPAATFGTAEVTGGTPYVGPDQAQLQRIAVGSHTGYDRLVLTFGTGPVPPFTVTPQDTASFTIDPSGQTVTLKGTSGVRVVVHNTVRVNQTVQDLVPLFPAIRQVRGVGDFEAVVSYGVGVAGATPRIRVLTLRAPSRLVVDVAWPDPA